MAFAEHNKAAPEWTEPWSGTVQVGPEEDDVCCNDSGISRHIVNWDPARALAEVDAKRRLLDLHPYAGMLSAPESCEPCAAHPGPCATLRLLTLPYADRPGYREEWRP